MCTPGFNTIYTYVYTRIQYYLYIVYTKIQYYLYIVYNKIQYYLYSIHQDSILFIHTCTPGFNAIYT